MKVMLIGSDASLSGAGLSMIALAEQLELMGIEVIRVVRPGNTQKILCERGIRYYSINTQSWVYKVNAPIVERIIVGIIKRLANFSAYFRLVRLIKKENPDIVHVNALTTYVGAKAAIKCKKKLVWHIRELLEEDLGVTFVNRKFALRLIKKSDIMIAISNVVYYKFHKLLPDVLMKRVYNGIDAKKFIQENHIIFENEKTIFTIAGRIEDNKGQLEVVYGIKEILEHYNAELWIVGSGQEKEIGKIRDAIKNLNIPIDKVIFWGYVADMPSVWKQTDVAVVASRCEAFGRVTIEAMASGCLVIGASSGGTTELIENGVTGLLYEQGNCEDMSNTFRDVMSDKIRMRHIAKSGQENVNKIYTAERNASEIADIYNMLLDDK